MVTAHPGRPASRGCRGMELRCPHCRSLVRIPDAMRRYFGMPVTCHECRRSFVVPPQSPLHDAALPADSIRPLDRSLSAARCFHERTCRRCGHRLRLPGLDRPSAVVSLSCPYCNTGFEIGGPRRAGPGAVTAALVVGIGVGGAILWLDHAGMIALHNLEASRLLLEWKQALRHFHFG